MNTRHGTRSTTLLKKEGQEEERSQQQQQNHLNILQEKKMVDHEANIMSSTRSTTKEEKEQEQQPIPSSPLKKKSKEEEQEQEQEQKPKEEEEEEDKKNKSSSSSSSSYQAALADANLVLDESMASPPPKENVSPSPPQQSTLCMETDQHDLSSSPRENHSMVERHHKHQQPFVEHELEHEHRHQSHLSPHPNRPNHLQQQEQQHHQRPIGKENGHFLPSPPPHSAPSAVVMNNGNSRSSGIASRRVKKLIIRVMKEGDKLGFGIRHDNDRRLKVSTLQTRSSAAASQLKINDTILSVNGVNLTHMSFLEVIQYLKTLRPGELCFEVERDLVSPRARHGSSNAPLGAGPPRGQPPVPLATSSGGLHPPRGTSSGPSPRAYSNGPSGSMGMGIVGPNPMGMDQQHPRKRARGIPTSPAEIDMEFRRLERSHRHEMNVVVMDLNKERTERIQLEEKNASLRKRLKSMLIECDEVRVNANQTITGLKEQASRDIRELEKALASARAQLRLLDRGPNFAAQDTLMSEMENYKIQLDRMRKIEVERTGYFKTRYAVEIRHAEREAYRVRDRLVPLFRKALKDAVIRKYSNTNTGAGTSTKPLPGSTTDSTTNPNATGKPGPNGKEDYVIVDFEGLRRLGFLKLFGLPSDLDHYASKEFNAMNQMHYSLQHHQMGEIFGNALCYEERPGYLITVKAPLDIVYDPATERLSLMCGWSEQNTLREMARNVRF